MGLLADFFVATDEDARKYDTDPSGFEPRIQSNGITPLEAAGLWDLLQGVEPRIETMDAFEALLVIDGGERLLHRCPDELRDALATLPEDKLDALAASWAALEELQWPVETAKDLLEGLVALAGTAKTREQSLFLWNCV